MELLGILEAVLAPAEGGLDLVDVLAGLEELAVGLVLLAAEGEDLLGDLDDAAAEVGHGLVEDLPGHGQHLLGPLGQVVHQHAVRGPHPHARHGVRHHRAPQPLRGRRRRSRLDHDGL